MRGKTGCVLVLLALAPTFSSLAQVTQFEGQKIVAIEYAPAQFLDPADLASAQPLKIGDTLHASDVAEAINGLFATGRFDDISVEAEKSGTGVSIRFVTKPRAFIGSVELTGKITAPPDKADLQSVTQLGLGSQFRDEDVTHAVDAMTRMFKANGLYDASVEPKIERPNPDAGGPQQVFITFEVKSGKRAKYEMPDITGTEAPLSESAILRATGWRFPLVHWWRRVTSAKTHGGAQAVQAKYESKDRLMARVDLKQVDYDEQQRRARPHLDITPGPVVKVTTVESKLSQRTLKKYVPVFEERDVDNDLLVEGERNLHDYLQSQGYYDADVEFRVQAPKNDLETIEYVISKGQRYRLVHLAINGNKYFDEDTLRERMFIAPKAFNLRRGRYSDAFRRRDEGSISDLYKANGFRDVKVEITEDRDYKGKAGDVSAMVNITEGPQWLVQSLTINGVSPTFRNQVLANVTSVQGQPFSEVTLAADRDSILTWYYTNGYPNANFKAEWKNASATKVDVVYTITEGNREYLRGVLLHGLHTTRMGTVNRRISLKAGDPLSPVEVSDIQRKLYDLGVFARVDTAIENPDGDTTHKYVLYDLEEANRYSVSVGLGAQVARFGQPSSQSLGSPAGTTGFSPEASLSVSRLNFLGVGHTVTLHGVYSTIEKSGSLSYQQPKFLGADTRTVTYSVVWDNELDVRTFASKREEASVQLSQKLSKATTALFRYAYRKVSVNNVVIPTLLIPQLLQPVKLSMVSSNLVRDTRDNASNPHRGSLNSIDIRLAAKFFGSQRSFGAALVRNATYYALTKNLILARQTEFGVIEPFAAPAGLSEAQSVPLPERFFAGGADSLRAFAFNEAGPRDTGAAVVPGGPSSVATGFPLGGNALFINNIELRFPLIGDNIQGVLFHDMGNVFSSLSDISFRYKQRNLQDFNYAVHAVGFGLRYKTPVGPVRADIAYSLNSPEFDGFSGTPQQILLCNPNDAASLQQKFCQVTQQNTGHIQFFFSIGQTF